MPALPRPLLSPEHIAMIDKGVSAIVASRNAAQRPSLMRAVGAAIASDGSEVTVGQIAVVFSEPMSHRTVQVKAREVELRSAVDSDAPVLRRYLRSMEHEIGNVGLSAAFVQAMLGCRLDDVVAIRFRPSEAYDQTPGPKAGSALPAA